MPISILESDTRLNLSAQTALFKQLFSNWLTVAGAIILLVGLLLALLPGLFATHDPLALDLPNRLVPPGADNFFGTDDC